MSTRRTLSLLVICIIAVVAAAAWSSRADSAQPGSGFDLKGQNSALTSVSAVETRDSGIHAIYLNDAIPDEGCDLTDRAIVLGTQDHGGAMLDAAMTALAYSRRVVVRVEGCSVLTPASKTTAPRVVRILIL